MLSCGPYEKPSSESIRPLARTVSGPVHPTPLIRRRERPIRFVRFIAEIIDLAFAEQAGKNFELAFSIGSDDAPYRQLRNMRRKAPHFEGPWEMVTRGISLYNTLEAILGRRSAWRLGRFLYHGARRELIQDPSNNGEYALQTWVLRALERQARDRSPYVFIDVGANIGDWTKNLVNELCARGMIQMARIHAFEPAPDQYSSLHARFADETKDGTVTVYPLALGAATNRSRFTVTGTKTGTSALTTGESRNSGEEIEVDVATFDSIASKLGFANVALLKIDTEGNDFNVIAGARQMLENEKVDVIQFEYNWRWVAFGYWLKSVFKLIENLHYSFGLLTQNGIEIHAVWHPELEQYVQTNYVLVHSRILPKLPHRRMKFDAWNTSVEAVDDK